MEVVLIILGVLGVGAILISTYVFMVAARTYVSDDPDQRQPGGRPHVLRSSKDRRSGQQVTFPLIVNGILIEKDRRYQPERRQAA